MSPCAMRDFRRDPTHSGGHILGSGQWSLGASLLGVWPGARLLVARFSKIAGSTESEASSQNKHREEARLSLRLLSIPSQACA